jgi:hypothetical protein
MKRRRQGISKMSIIILIYHCFKLSYILILICGPLNFYFIIERASLFRNFNIFIQKFAREAIDAICNASNSSEFA